jgi:ribosomal-protein-alanine N-acetyltransferase
MTTSASITITPLERQHRRAIDDLLFHSYQVHTHMDWYEPMEWLENVPAPVRLAWQGSRLAGVLAISRPLNGTSWIRIAALHDHTPSHTVMNALWQAILPELHALGVKTVSALIMRNWIRNYLQVLNFHFVEDVITMERGSAHLPDVPDIGLKVRSVRPDDLARLARIDQTAFNPPWQMTLEEIRQAQRLAEICLVAEFDQQILGFQISTLYREGGHLARLAVDPQVQGRGVGTFLLHDLLRRFLQRHVTSVTVNTQISNRRSQRLYRHFGFNLNGYDLPVWSIHTAGDTYHPPTSA